MSTESATVTIHNRPATIERELGDRAIVRWQDNGTQGVVTTAALEETSDE